ncbi:MAG TPA: DEAD/DEAH box helicase [Chloroflexota bacterium]|nr:DEAD/DEAH box helicase [Chloroflexota bacterium]
MTTEFLSLGLHPQVVQAVTELGFTEPTPIQTAVIPLMLNGQDIIGQAQTGTGKTAAFGLPILHTITPGLGQVQALIVAPTRELALQVAGALEGYGRYRQATVLAIYGGQAYGRQKRQLRQGEVDIVVGTPGRLLDLIQQKILDLSQVRFLVLDEADEMLSMGFIEDMEAILAQTPESRQTALFSATMPAEIRRLADNYLRQPQAVTMQRQQLTLTAIEQRYYLVNEVDKLAALTRLFEMEEMTSVLIFARTRQGTGELANELTVRGFPAEALNGDLSQDNREQVLNRFRQNQIKVLVATDVAARGLDIEDISHVINFDLPTDPEIFVHRIGRTGRAGKTGIAISLVTPKEQFRRRKIERYTRQNMSQRPLPTIAEIQAIREAQLVEGMLVWLRRGRCRQEREMVEKLVAEGYDAVEIAAAAMKLARAEEKQRPIAPVSEVVTEPLRERNGRTPHHSAAKREFGHGRAHSTRSHEKGMVRLSLSAGKQHGIRPNDVVGTIAFHADIPGRAIGAIQIQEQHTLVDVPEQFVAQVLAKNGKYQVRKRPLTVERV